MPEVTIIFDDAEEATVRCYPHNSHLILKLGTVSLYLGSALLPIVRDAITECLKQTAKVAKKKTTKKRKA